MGLSLRTQNAIIAVLAVLAVGASIFAMWSVRQPHPSLASDEVAVTQSASGPTDAAPTATSDTTDAEVTTAEATDEVEVTASPTTEAEPPAPNVAGWVDAWAQDADLLVIGDGLSNRPSQWVQWWATQVANDRPVTIHHWGEASDVGFNDPHVLSESDGASLTVWSASRDGSTVADAADHYATFVDASNPPDAVLISLGLDSASEDVAAGLDELVDQIDEDVPVLIAIGPEGLYDEGVGDQFLDWAQDHEDRVSVLDLREATSATPTAEEWARAFQESLQG